MIPGSHSDTAAFATAPAQGFDLGGQFLRGKGFWQIIIGAGIEPIHPFIQMTARGKQQHGSLIPALPQDPQHTEPVPAGQHDIEHDGIIAVFQGLRQGLIPPVADLHHKAFPGEGLADKLRGFRFIFDHQDFHGID